MGLRSSHDDEKKKGGHPARSSSSPVNGQFSVSPLFSLPSKPCFSRECPWACGPPMMMKIALSRDRLVRVEERERS
jgi:hypothetical protein